MKPKQTSKREWRKAIRDSFRFTPAEGEVFEEFVEVLLQSFADEVIEKVIEGCLHDFHGPIDITGIVDSDEARQALTDLCKKYGLKIKPSTGKGGGE